MLERFPSESEIAKRKLLEELLQDGLVTIQLDPRREGVDVPPNHMEQPALTLNLSHAFQLDIFELKPLVVVANLSFGTDRYRCSIPYQAIYAVLSQAHGKHYLFPEDVPVELAAQFEALTEDAGRDLENEPGDGSSAGGLEGTETQTPDETEDPESTAPSGPHLRLLT